MDDVAGVVGKGAGLALACTGAEVDWEDLAGAELAAGTRSRKVDSEGSGLDTAEPDCATEGATGGFIRILLVTTLLFE